MKIDCKGFAEEWKADIKRRVGDLHPRLAIVQVGNNPASNAYVRGKIKDCAEVGIEATLHKFEDDADTSKVRDFVRWLSEDRDLSGIIVQLPLPPTMDKDEILSEIDPYKDVDGLMSNKYIPCTPLGIMKLLEHMGYNCEGKNAVVLGRSELVGKPMAEILLDQNATVTVCHSKTTNIGRSQALAGADIVVSAVGSPGLIRSSMLGDGCVVIDVGITRGEDGKLHGDFELTRETDADRIRYTTVPGGVGLLTRAALLENTLEAARKKYLVNLKIGIDNSIET